MRRVIVNVLRARRRPTTAPATRYGRPTCPPILAGGDTQDRTDNELKADRRRLRYPFSWMETRTRR